MIQTSENKSKKALIVDDDEFLLDMYVMKFKEAGFLVEVAKSGPDALAKAKEFQPAIILLDIVLPGMDGFEVLQEIKSTKACPNTKILMLSNLGQKDDTEKAIKLGAEDYIVKAHFTPSEVLKKVMEVLNK